MSPSTEISPQQDAVLGVVIVTFNSGSEAVDCTESLLAAGRAAGMRLHVVLVDNASTDDTVPGLKRWMSGETPYTPPDDLPFSPLPLPKPLAPARDGSRQESRVDIVEMPVNRGFAGGVNAGLAHLACFKELQHFWVLNPDSVVPPETLHTLSAWLQTDPDYGLAGGRVCYMHRPDQIQIDGGQVDFSTGVTRNVNLGRTAATCDAPDAATLDFIMGASVIASRAFYDQVGPMREDYFLYYEEVDWALRRGDMALTYITGLLIYHRAGTAIGSPVGDRLASPFSLYFKHRGRVRLLQRFGRPGRLKAGLYTWAIAARLLVKHRAPKHAWAVLAGAFGLPPPDAVRARLSPEAAALAFAPPSRDD